MEKNLPPARAKPPVAPPPLYVIHSMGRAKGRGKGRRAKYVGEQNMLVYLKVVLGDLHVPLPGKDSRRTLL